MPYLVLGLAQGLGVDQSVTQFLVHSDTTDGSTTFTDSGPNTIALSLEGNADHSTDFAKFGATSMHFPNGWLSHNRVYGSDAVFNVGTGDFTIDCWIYINGAMNGLSGAVSTMNGLGGANGFGLINTVANGSEWALAVGNNTAGTNYGTVAVPSDQWVHLAGVRSGGQASMAINGVFGTWAASTQSAENTSVSIGGRYGTGGGTGTNLYVDEVRIATGAAWTSDFTPPTAPYSS